MIEKGFYMLVAVIMAIMITAIFYVQIHKNDLGPVDVFPTRTIDHGELAGFKEVCVTSGSRRDFEKYGNDIRVGDVLQVRCTIIKR